MNFETFTHNSLLYLHDTSYQMELKDNFKYELCVMQFLKNNLHFLIFSVDLFFIRTLLRYIFNDVESVEIYEMGQKCKASKYSNFNSRSYEFSGIVCSPHESSILLDNINVFIHLF